VNMKFNVFYSTFTNVFYSCHVFTFFNVFLILISTFFTSMVMRLRISGSLFPFESIVEPR